MNAKPCKIIQTENGIINIIGNHHYRDIEYDCTPEAEPFFLYKGEKVYLNEFLRTNKGDLFYDHGFHGYTPDSLWTTYLIKYCDTEEAVQIYRSYLLG